MKLNKGQAWILGLAATPMAVVGAAGAIATYVNMDSVLHRSASALGMVAAGEGATLICALVALAVTLMGQHTPSTVRIGMWLVPLLASGVGVALAPSQGEAVVMGFTPMAMTASGEGIAFVARRMVAYTTGVDIEKQRSSGLLLWHANRAQNGSRIGRRLSRPAVWRLTKRFAMTDTQLSVQLGEIQRFRISQQADENLAAALAGPEKDVQATPAAPAALPGPVAPAEPPAALSGPYSIAAKPMPKWVADEIERQAALDAQLDSRDELDAHLAEVAAEAEATVKADPSVQLLTTAQVAKLKGVQNGTVRSWKHRNKLPYTMVDGVPMFHPADVAALD